MDLARASKGQILQSLARQTKPSSWQGFVYARTVAFHRIIEIPELEGTHKVHRVQLLSLRERTPKFPPCVYRHICRNLGKQKSGSCRRGGIERHFYPTFQPCFPWMWWRATIKCEPCIPTTQSLTRSEKSKSQDTGDLKPYWTQKLSALSRRNRRESVLTRLHGKVCRPIFWGAQVHSNMCCMGGGCLWGQGHPDVRYQECWSALGYFFSFLPSHPNISVTCRRRSGVAARPWMVFILHSSTTVFLIKPSRT